MSILTLGGQDNWQLDYDLEPHEFWPYTTIVVDVVFAGPRSKFGWVEHELIRLFNEAGIKARIDNKTAYAVKDNKGRVWYFGFRDASFSLGMDIRPDSWLKPLTKELVVP